MVRFARAALLLLGVCSFVTTSDAARLATENLASRQYLTNTGYGDWRQVGSGTAGFNDSTTFSVNVTGASTSAQQDTTAPFRLTNWACIPTQPGNTVTAVDTLYGFSLLFAGSTTLGSTTAFDTLSATLQGSVNGVDWVSAPTVRIVEPTSGNMINKMYNVIWSTPVAAGTGVTNTILHMPMLRFIFGGGGVYGGTNSGQFQALIQYWQDTGSGYR